MQRIIEPYIPNNEGIVDCSGSGSGSGSGYGNGRGGGFGYGYV